ncbi:MAG: C39 family peptidase [Candidatus Babeliales bacterium]|jgi:hypothetical protein
MNLTQKRQHIFGWWLSGFLGFFCCCSQVVAGGTQTPSQFSHTICKFFSDNELGQLESQVKSSDVIWEKVGVSPFSELIVSWNSLRPSHGTMLVWVSVRHAGQWSRWHRLAEWKQNGQRTFVNKLNRYVHTKHCRVELQQGAEADGFRVRFTFEDMHDVKKLKAAFACLSRLDNFCLIRPRIDDLPSVAVRGVPRQSQMLIDHPRCCDLCSPTSTSMIVAYLCQKIAGNVVPSMHDYARDFAEKVHDDGIDIYGNWILNVAQAFDATGGTAFFRVERLNSFYDLHRYLVQKMPVAVSVRRLPGGATPYANGHIMVVVGWNRQKSCVLCQDPAFGSNKAVLKAYPLLRFLRAWGRSCNLAYVPMMRPD